MEQKQLDRLNQWFDNYVAGFYGDDDFVNANIKLKEVHSRQTCRQMRYLTEQLKLQENPGRIAEAIALLHDVGRFPQFTRYRTFNDTRSVPHAELSIEVLAEKNVLAGIDAKEKDIIEKAIKLHGTIELPANLDGEHLLYCRLIRDADKLDIYRVVLENYRAYRDDPRTYRLEQELPDEPRCSADVVEGVAAGQRVDYRKLKVWNDMKILQLGWVFDMNFGATLRRVREEGYLEEILEFLPDSEDVRRVKKAVFDYVEKKTAG